MYQTLREPPEKGSLRESILILYVMKLQEIAYLKDLALAQLIVDKSNLDKFKAYQHAMFPWIVSEEKRDMEEHIKLLSKAVDQGPMRVTAMEQKRPQSRLIHRVARNSPELSAKKNEIYKKLGSMF